MPVSFLTAAQRACYGRYAAPPSPDELARFFHLSEDDQTLILSRRGDHNRLGFALQLTTVRFLGTFLEDSITVPSEVVQTLSRQLGITKSEAIGEYRQGRWRRQHAAEIRARFGYRDFSDPAAGFRLARWLCALCWTGTERPSVLFDRATAWLLTHKVLLPGVSVLERFIARLRGRMENRLWRSLGRDITAEQRVRLEGLLTVPEGSRASGLERLRLGPVTVSGPALVRALERLQDVRGLEIRLPATVHVAPTRLASLARFAGAAKVTSITRLAPARRLATLVAFVHCLEATAQDEALEVLEMLLHDLFGHATQAYTKARLRTLKDLDQAAIVLVKACRPLLDPALPDGKLRAKVFAKIPRAELAQALEAVETLVRPPDDVYYRELAARYRGVRRFLPAVLKHLRFETNPAGEPVVEAFKWLGANEPVTKPANDAPREVISKAWRHHVLREGGTMDYRAYTFCVLHRLYTALRRRDVFVRPSWRYADPRAGLLTGSDWEVTRPIICRTLGLTPDPEPVLKALADELDQTYRAVAARLPSNPAVRFETVEGKKDLVLSPLDKLEEPPSLLALRGAVAARLPRVDLPEILLEIASRTGFTDAFTHLTERTARAADLNTSLCAVLLAEACNTGLEPLVHNDFPALRRERLSWVNQNYIREETLLAANVKLVSAQNQIALARAWGGGEVAWCL